MGIAYSLLREPLATFKTAADAVELSKIRIKMNTKKIVLAAITALGFAVMAPQTIAAPIPVTFNFFGTPAQTGLLGSSEAYTAGGATITAYSGGYSGNTVFYTRQLNGVNETDYQGLGVCGGTGTCNDGGGSSSLDGLPTELIQLDVSNLYTNGYRVIKINSDGATDGDLLRVYASNSATTLGTLLASVTDAAGDFTLATGAVQYKYLNFIAASSDADSPHVLLHSLTASVPEPASLALFGLGLAGLGVIKRRKLKKTDAA